MSLLAGRLLTLGFYGGVLSLLLVVLSLLRWRSMLVVFLIPLAWMSFCYSVLVYLTLEQQPWEFMIPFIQIGQWLHVVALGALIVMELIAARGASSGGP